MESTQTLSKCVKSHAQEFVLLTLTHLHSLNTRCSSWLYFICNSTSRVQGGESGAPVPLPHSIARLAQSLSHPHATQASTGHVHYLKDAANFKGWKSSSYSSYSHYCTQNTILKKKMFKFWAQVGNEIYSDRLKTEKPTNKTANSNMSAFVQVEWWQSPMYAHLVICCSQRSQEPMWRGDANHLWMSDSAKLYICKSNQLRDCWDCYPS